MTESRNVTRSVAIETTPELAFEALTRGGELREWFCDEARTQPQPGGRYEVRWSQGYRAEGRFTEMEAPQHAAITWRGSGEPGETSVRFSVAARDGGVELSVQHSGFGPGSEWDGAVAQADRGWASGLENLKSILESGIDLRLARTPFMGILYEYWNAERAAKEGIPVGRGIYVADTVEGTGARAAGLGHGDVIVAIDGVPTDDIDALQPILSARRAGDTIQMELVRGKRRETVAVTLGSRPVEELPASTEELAGRLAARIAETDSQFKAVLEGVTEEEAERAPAPGEWSVKQVLAHLSTGERDTQCYLFEMALGGWPEGVEGNAEAANARHAAALSVTPTVQGMVERMVAEEAETVAMLRFLPREAMAHPARMRRIAQNMRYHSVHTQEHIAQIEATIQAVRGN
jgi:uncharacterized protein YndB with AHSA1/START domain